MLITIILNQKERNKETNKYERLIIIIKNKKNSIYLIKVR